MNISMSMYASSADYWKAQAEANAKDAERYRWLRDHAYHDGDDGVATPWCVCGIRCVDAEPIHTEWLDAAVDDRIAAVRGVGAA